MDRRFKAPVSASRFMKMPKSPRVDVPDFATQIVRPKIAAGGVNEICLAPVGRLEGRVIAAQPELLRDMYLVVETGDNGGSDPMGSATPKVAADGHFVVPYIATGNVTLFARLGDERLPVRPRLISCDKAVVAANHTTRIEIPLESTVTVHGLLRMKGTGKPVAGVAISVRHCDDNLFEDAQSDASGRFEAQVLPGKVNAAVIYTPAIDEIQPSESRNAQLDVPGGASDFNLPPIDIVKCPLISGRLLGKDGTPLANSRLSAFAGEKFYTTTITDERGDFNFWGVPAGIGIDRYQVPAAAPQQPAQATVVVSEKPLVLRLK
jgi:hypothetical protein